MTTGGIPDADIDISPSLVRALLEDQHPDLAHLTLVDVGHGWDNKIFRLGYSLAVRLPRRSASAGLVATEQRWLPELAPRLPLPIPAPVRIGVPACGYPWSWSIVPWLVGEPAALAHAYDPDAVAGDIGAFVRALHQPAPGDAPLNPFRGVPLAHRTHVVRDRVAQLGALVEGREALALWERALSAGAYSGPAVWLHGDLHPANLLVNDGLLSAVIDFGDLTAGDPATDLAIAWMLLPPRSRSVFRTAARDPSGAVDDGTWMRARGWALLIGLAFLTSSRDSALMERLGRSTVEAVLADIA
jgi:aminoglycoside phosphotransferase (APT) family kinase protein